jgi:hypothetical protein
MLGIYRVVVGGALGLRDTTAEVREVLNAVGADDVITNGSLHGRFAFLSHDRTWNISNSRIVIR